MFMEQVHFHFEDELNPVCQNTVMQKCTIQQMHWRSVGSNPLGVNNLF